MNISPQRRANIRFWAFALMTLAGVYAGFLVFQESPTPDGRDYRTFFNPDACTAADFFQFDLGQPEEIRNEVISERAEFFDHAVKRMLNHSGAEYPLEIGLGPLPADHNLDQVVDWNDLDTNRIVFYSQIQREGSEEHEVLVGLEVSAHFLYTKQAMPNSPSFREAIKQPGMVVEIERNALVLKDIVNTFKQFNEPYDGLHQFRYSSLWLRSMKSGAIADAALSVWFTVLIQTHLQALEKMKEGVPRNDGEILAQKIETARGFLQAAQAEAKAANTSWPLAYYQLLIHKPRIHAAIRAMNIKQQIPFWVSVAAMFTGLALVFFLRPPSRLLETKTVAGLPTARTAKPASASKPQSSRVKLSPIALALPARLPSKRVVYASNCGKAAEEISTFVNNEGREVLNYLCSEREISLNKWQELKTLLLQVKTVVGQKRGVNRVLRHLTMAPPAELDRLLCPTGTFYRQAFNGTWAGFKKKDGSV